MIPKWGYILYTPWCMWRYYLWHVRESRHFYITVLTLTNLNQRTCKVLNQTTSNPVYHNSYGIESNSYLLLCCFILNIFIKLNEITV